MMYFMYTLEDAEIVPYYVGISQKVGYEGDLNWNFKNFPSDSVFGRWGYGSSQHLGELSKAMWPNAYDDSPEPKYKRWREKLFVDGTRVLKRPMYIEFLPWDHDNLLWSEENIVRIMSRLHPDKLLNTEYNDSTANKKITDYE